MTAQTYKVEAKTPFSESLIWQLNRDYYQKEGIKAWSEGAVPHQLTSSAKVGKTYAELIFAFLKDLAVKGRSSEIVYILELGAGHGRLAFHILKQLQRLIDSTVIRLPQYCYVLSDIVEDNLSFFQHHPQLQPYLQQGLLDIAYFDGIGGTELHLRYSQKSIYPQSLSRPILAIANYFFDSIPNDLFFIKDKKVSSCSVSIDSSIDPKGLNVISLINDMEVTYHNDLQKSHQYENPILNEMLNEYKELITNSYLFFPQKSIRCIQNIQDLSSSGLVLLTMDKGHHELHKLSGKKQPDIIVHGSFSLWVNYHALSTYCKKLGGTSLFSTFSNFHLEIGCLMFLPDGETYPQTHAAYQQFVNNFGPDDFNSIKQLAYFNVSRLKFRELIAIFRLSAYDSSIFINFLPRLRQLTQTITHNDRERLIQTIHCVWDMYFHINESYDLPYELGGVLYDLGCYKKALDYFQHSIDLFESKSDSYYNRALCFYQLREDQSFYDAVSMGQKLFPDSKLFEKLLELDMSS